MAWWKPTWPLLLLLCGGCSFDHRGLAAWVRSDLAPGQPDAWDARPVPDGPEPDRRLLRDQAADVSTCPWAGWTSRTRLTFNNLFSTAVENHRLDNFPVLVVLTQQRLAGLSLQPDGRDLRFVDADGTTSLAFEVESWASGGPAYVWVKVPLIDKGSTQDHIWLYHGNPAAAAPPASGKQVWSNGFRAVYHLQQDPAATAPQFLDATGNGNDASIGPLSSVSQISGKIGGAVQLGGTYDDLLEAPDSPSLAITTGITLEGWVRPDSINQQLNRHLVLKAQAYFLQVLRTFTDKPSIYVNLSPSLGWFARNAGGPPKAGAWNHIAGTYDTAARRLRIYMDGTLAAEKELPDTVPVSHTISTASTPLRIGRAVNGAVDEVRVAATRRSHGWIAAQHRSMTDSFITYGPAEVACP